MITHAIFSDKLMSDPDDAYQIAGRITGNVKEFPDFKRVEVFCSKPFARQVVIMERRAKRFAEYLIKHSKRTAETEDYVERCIAE